MFTLVKKYKKKLLLVLEILISCLGILFVFMHVFYSFLLFNYGFTFLFNIIIFILITNQIFKMKYFRKKYKKVIYSLFILFLSFCTIFIIIFDFLFLLVTKPRVTIDSYKIRKNEYLKTISYETMISDNNDSSLGNPIEVIYQKDFGFGIQCYTVMSVNDINFYKYSTRKEQIEYIKREINLKEIYSKIDKEISFCGTNLRNVNY